MNLQFLCMSDDKIKSQSNEYLVTNEVDLIISSYKIKRKICHFFQFFYTPLSL